VIVPALTVTVPAFRTGICDKSRASVPLPSSVSVVVPRVNERSVTVRQMSQAAPIAK
jgi:hypothetical protein